MAYPELFFSENETVVSEFRPLRMVAAKPLFLFVLAMAIGVTLGVLLPDFHNNKEFILDLISGQLVEV